MRRIVAIALPLILAATAPSVAGAQACLGVNDGLGDTSISCPDGRSGYLRADPNGVAAGMVGTQPYALQTGPMAGAPATGPRTLYVAPPLPPLAAAPPPPSAAPTVLPPLTPAPQLTPLEIAHLRAQAARNAARARRSAEAAAQRLGR